MNQKVKILIIRFSSIGDIVLTSPVIRCLKLQLDGEVELHFLTKNLYSSILAANPRITKVYGIDKSTNELIKELKSEQYDYIIDLHKNLRTKRVIKNLRVLSFTFDKLNVKKWLITALKINQLPDLHIVERYLQAVHVLGVENDGLGLEYYIPEKDEINLNELPCSHQNGYVSFAIGAQHNTKRLPFEKIVELLKSMNLPVVLLGGKQDSVEADLIMKIVGDGVYNACGRFNLNQSACLVRQSKVLLTHDTGLMHIGAALGVQIVSIWGNTIPEFGMYPYYPKNPDKFVIIENKELNCRPCSKIGYDKCPKKHFNCMVQLENAKIINAVLGFYNN